MKESKPETVFVTKCALSHGIYEAGVVVRFGDNFSVEVLRPEPERNRWSNTQMLYGNDYHTTREAAVARAEEMRLAKIASHERSIEKLQAMSFDAAETEKAP